MYISSQPDSTATLWLVGEVVTAFFA